MVKLVSIVLVVLLVVGLPWNVLAQTEIETFDYLVIGAGTTGAATAAKLGAEYPTALLEFGPDESQLHDPETVRNLDNNKWLGYNNEADVHLSTVPQPLTLFNGTTIWRSFETRRYKGVHGCNAHNAGWARYGVKKMYDRWPIGWKSKDMKRYLDEAFDAMSSSVPSKHAALQAKIMNEWQAATGYPIIRDSKLKEFSKLGIQKSLFNHIRHNDTYFERVSSFDAFTRRELAKKKTKLKLVTFKRVERILWEWENGYDEEPTARAVLTTDRLSGQIKIYYARREVLFAAGAFDNVGLLQRSGIGNCTELQAMNISCVVDNPNVGEGFLYHMVLAPLMSVTEDDKVIEPNSQFTTQAGVAISTEGTDIIDATIDFHMETNELYTPSPPLPKPLAYGILLSMRDFGPGKITIDPSDHHKLLIDLRLFQNDWEIPHMIRVFREYRRLLNASSVYREFAPGLQVQSLQDMHDYVVQNIQFGEHPISSNQMFKVVDNKLRVYGVKGLRLLGLDTIVNGNHVNPNMMAAALGLKAADIILKDARRHY